MKKIVVVGSSNTDLIIKVPEIARPGETILGGRFQTFPGGKGANQAVAAARSGGNVAFIAAVGDDAYGEEALRLYRQDNINTGYIKICKDIPSGIAMITISDSGENAITVAPGANSELLPGDLDDAEEAFREADYMLVQLETPIETVQNAVELCVKFKTVVILNPAPAVELPEEILAVTDIITPNKGEAEKLTGVKVEDERGAARASKKLHELGVKTVIITMGSQGAFLSNQISGVEVMIRGFEVNAVDTTAAGDVFNGQLAVALAEGKNMRDSIRIAHSAAALSVQKLGAQNSIPRREETDSFMKSLKK